MKIKYMILAFFAATLSFGACSSKLDIPRKGVLDKSSYYRVDENILSASASLYFEVRGWEYNVILCKNMLTDDFHAGGAARGDNKDLEQLNEFSFDTQQPYIENMFKTYYALVYKANVILESVDPNVSEVAKMAVAEAHLFRAWAYFDLITLWGNPPVVDHQLSPSEYSVGNGETSALWKLVEDDLTAAISSGALPSKSDINDKKTWRVTKEYAAALLGKAYLWMAKDLKDDSYYAKSADAFEQIISSGKYDLFKGAEFGDMAQMAYDMNCESVFDSQRVNDNTNPGDNTTIFVLMTGWRSDHMEIPDGVTIRNCWGFMLPTKNLYDAFEKYEGEDSYRRKQTMKSFDELRDMGVKITNDIVSEGFWNWKTRVVSSEVTNSGWRFHRNVHWMRYAEVLLCAAEANFRAGNTDKAVKYVNIIRERAKLTPLATVTLDDIKMEKRLELVGEAVRFQDLVRWGDAATALGGNGKTYPVCSPSGVITLKPTGRTKYGFKSGKHERLPYPYTETMLNKNIKQNLEY